MQANKLITKNKDKLEIMARLGFVSRGLVYGTIGFLTAKFAMGMGGKPIDTHAAIKIIGASPFGKVLLVLLVFGLAGYAVWRFIEGIMDTEQKGNDMKGLAQRGSYISIGVINLLLSFACVKLLFKMGKVGGDQTKSWTAKLMSQPFGLWLVGIAGLMVVGGGCFQFYKAYSDKAMKKLKLEEMDANSKKLAKYSARIGLSARGITFCIIGIFLIQAALKENPHEARGLSGALYAIASQPFGFWLLLIVASGFIIYALYSLISARFEKINV